MSEPYARVIDRALEFQREDRYESAAAMREDVRGPSRSSRSTIRQPSPPKPPSSALRPDRGPERPPSPPSRSANATSSGRPRTGWTNPFASRRGAPSCPGWCCSSWSAPGGGSTSSRGERVGQPRRVVERARPQQRGAGRLGPEAPPPSAASPDADEAAPHVLPVSVKPHRVGIRTTSPNRAASGGTPRCSRCPR